MAKRTLPDHRQMTTTTVMRTRRLSESFLRVTVGAESLDAFAYQGFDTCIRVFFPRPGQTRLRMPSAANNGWVAQFYLIPIEERPHVRNYTIRDYRPQDGEIDIDFVLHGDSIASSWAAGLTPGDPVGLFNEGAMYRPRESADWQLIIADETGVPAALVIAEQSSPDLETVLYLEVPHAADRLEAELGANRRVTWLAREDGGIAVGERVLSAVRSAALPSGDPTVFIAGESSLATGARRHLVRERGIAKKSISFYGYWKAGRASLG